MTTVIGKKITLLEIPKNVFVDKDNPLVKGKIRIDLVECYSRRDIIESGIDTWYKDSQLFHMVL